MTTLTVELPAEAYRRLDEEAHRLGKPPQTVAQEWLMARLAPRAPAMGSDRERARQALRHAGLLVELGPDLRAHADPTVRLEEVGAALARAGGQPLSEIVLEQRGSRG